MAITAAELLVKVGYDDSELESGTKRSSGIVSTLGKGLLALGAGAAVGLGAVGVMGIKAAGDFQQTQISFEGLLGSAEKANSFLADMRDFAARTPFEMSGLTESAKMLMATGTAADQVIPTLTKLGNAASALGVGPENIQSVVRALGQMQGKGKVSAEEINQIGEAMPGFSAWGAIAKGAGITIAEAMDMAANGALSAADSIPMIIRGMEEFPGAAGAMERQSATLNGVISTMKDNFTNALVDGILPFIPGLANLANHLAPLITIVLDFAFNALGSLVRIIAGIIPTIQMFGQQFLLAFSAASWSQADGMVGVIENIGAAFGMVFPIIVGVVTQAWSVLQGLFSFLAENSAVTIGLLSAAGAILVAMFTAWAVSAAIAAVNTFLAVAPVLALLAAIGLLAIGIVYLWQTNETFRTVILVIWNAIQEIITSVIATIQAVIGAFVSVAIAFWDTFGSTITALVGLYFGLVENSIRTVLGVIEGVWNAFAGAFTGDWSRVWSGISQVFSSIWNGILGTVEAIWGAIGGAVSNGIDSIVGFVLGMPGRISGAFSGMFDGLYDAFRSAANRVIGGWNSLSFSIGGGSYDPLGSLGPTVNVPSFTLNTPNLSFLASGTDFVQRSGLAFLHQGERVVPAIAATPYTGGGSTINQEISIQMAPGSDGEDVVNALRRYQRINGSIPITVG